MPAGTGAPSVAREWHYRGTTDGILQLRVDRRTSGPYGVADGAAGASLLAVINPGTDRALDTGKITTALKPGDRLRIQVAGGWGAPEVRDPQAALADVQNELVSPERARTVYRVAIDNATESVDEAETARLRAKAEA